MSNKLRGYVLFAWAMIGFVVVSGLLTLIYG